MCDIGECQDCNTEYREITYPVVSSKPGKPWSPCTGAGCNHPSHEEAAAER